MCRSKRSFKNIKILMKQEKFRVKKREEEYFMELINKLADNTRRWENNGYTNKEIREIKDL